MKHPADPHDPKELIRESYRMEGITAAECRSIFLDWALSLPLGEDTGVHIRGLLERYEGGAGMANAEHPMSRVLREGLGSLAAPRRRGGWRSRRPN